LAAGLSECEMCVAAIVRVTPRVDQTSALERPQRAAQVAAVDAERRGDAARRRSITMRELVQHPDLGERELAAEVRRAERPDAMCVEAIEKANNVGALVDRPHESIPMADEITIGELIDFVNYSPRRDRDHILRSCASWWSSPQIDAKSCPWTTLAWIIQP